MEIWERCRFELPDRQLCANLNANLDEVDSLVVLVPVALPEDPEGEEESDEECGEGPEEGDQLPHEADEHGGVLPRGHLAVQEVEEPGGEDEDGGRGLQEGQGAPRDRRPPREVEPGAEEGQGPGVKGQLDRCLDQVAASLNHAHLFASFQFDVLEVVCSYHRICC